MYDELTLDDKYSRLPEIALAKRPDSALEQLQRLLIAQINKHPGVDSTHTITSDQIKRYHHQATINTQTKHQTKAIQSLGENRDYKIKLPYRKQTPKISLFMNRIQSEVKQINTVLKAHIEATNHLLQNKMDHIIGEICRYKSQKLNEQYNSDQQPESQNEEYQVPFPNNYQKSKKLVYKNRKEIPKIRTRLSKQRIMYLTSKWKKCGNCVLFIIYLKRFYNKMRSWKQKESEKIIQALPAHFNTLRQTIQVNLHKFANLLYSKQEILYDISQSDSKEVGRQKIELARITINTLLKQMLVVFKANKNNNVFAKFLYIMCKHGNFCAKKGLLTKEELKVSCISQAYKTIAANHLLQKVSLINFIFIKLVLYKIFFSEDRLSQAMKLQNTPKNIYIIGSILYTLAIEMQNDLLQKVPNNYKLGNYLQFSSIILRPSLVLSHSSTAKGEILSGLRDRRWIKVVYKTSGWELERNILRQIIKTAYETIVKFHAMLIKTIK